MFRYDKHTEVVRFGAAIVPKCYRENGRIVTFTCAITLDVAQAADDYGTMGADDTLPVPLGETEETFDWQTGTVTLGVKSDYYQKRTKPARKIAAHFSGLHAQRDELLRLFLAHCRTPVIYKNHGETLRVIFPDKFELTDHLEAGNVNGQSESTLYTRPWWTRVFNSDFRGCEAKVSRTKKHPRNAPQVLVDSM